MSDEKERDDGIRMMPGDSVCVRNTAKWTSIVHVRGDQHSPLIRRQFQDFGIRSAIRDDANVAFKIYARFTAADSAPNIGIKIGVGLELDLQAILGTFPLRERPKGSIMSGGSGWPA